MKGAVMAVVFSVLLVSSANAADDVKNKIIQRCRSQMGEYGAAMMKACVDQDIEADKALSNY